jgi:hypothetical protein
VNKYTAVYYVESSSPYHQYVINFESDGELILDLKKAIAKQEFPNPDSDVVIFDTFGNLVEQTDI